MKSSQRTRTGQIIFKGLITTTCLGIIVFLYSQYQQEKVSQERYDALFYDVLSEVDANVRQQVYFEEEIWSGYYANFLDENNSRKRDIDRATFQDVTQYGHLIDPQIIFHSSRWELAQKSPDFMQKIPLSYLERLTTFYNYLNETESIYELLYTESQSVLNNYQDSTFFDKKYQERGSFLKNALLLDIYRSNILMYAENIFYNGEIEKPVTYEELRQRFDQSTRKRFEKRDSIK